MKLGAGAYGTVYKVKRSNSDEYVAIKEMDMSLFKDQAMIVALKTEVEIMKSLKDEHIVNMYESNIGTKYAHIVLELCDSDLRKKL